MLLSQKERRALGVSSQVCGYHHGLSFLFPYVGRDDIFIGSWMGSHTSFT